MSDQAGRKALAEAASLPLFPPLSTPWKEDRMGTEIPDAGAGDRPPETLTPAARLAYLAVFEAITDGWNRKAARLLRGLDPGQLTELAVICGDVRTLAEAERRRRGETEPGPDGSRERDVLDDIDDAVAGITDADIGDRFREALRRAGYYEPATDDAVRGFTAALARIRSDPREQQRITDISALVDAGDFIYAQALAALRRGDRDAAWVLLRWCANEEIGDSEQLLAILEAIDRTVTPEHIAKRFRELLDDVGEAEAPEAEQ